jgi:hypothetical protein
LFLELSVLIVDISQNGLLKRATDELVVIGISANLELLFLMNLVLPKRNSPDRYWYRHDQLSNCEYVPATDFKD